jgi:hypothetical protein
VWVLPLPTFGSNVNIWNDQSGNGNHATASSAAARPTYVTNSVNTIPSLDFDGTNDELQVPDAASLDLTNGIFLLWSSLIFKRITMPGW